MTHRATIDFLLHDWLQAERLCQRERHLEHSRETFNAVLDLSEKIPVEQFAPVNRLLDIQELLSDSGIGREMRRAVSFLGEDLDALEESSAGYAGPVKCQVAGPWTLAAAIE